MKRFLIAGFVFLFLSSVSDAGEVSLFDGKSMEGWEGDAKIWRVEDGALTGGSLTEMVKRNEFLATKRDYTNFVIRFKIKLTGTEGFINSGFQIRSQRVPNSGEMKGYQCDFGEPNWYGAIYDEERRNRVVSASDMEALRPVIKKDDWNDYVIRAEGRRVQTFINGVRGTDFIEQDAMIPDWGKLGIQVHGGGKAVVQVKDIFIEELPAQPKFIGAPEPAKAEKASPLRAEEERGTFTLPPGFEMELVAEEQEGIGKFVAVSFDTQGRMWSMTALEYPVDANEAPEVAKALYASIAKDKVLVWDKPFGPGPHKPRVFAEGLAIPLGLLPYKDGAYVQHGADIKFLRDTNGDGKADKSETILTGFGVQDSHLFPHQFTRAPGNWIWFAQGAFNYGKVKTSKGVEQQFDQTRMAKFRYDGSDFDITSQGPCNIWGLVLKTNGEAFIQEANDYGYPMMPFHEYANYPGCSDGQMKSYAPVFPGTAPDFQMGGTGLSGLAQSDAGHWPAPYDNIFYVANPITRKIQAIRLHEDGPRYRLEKLPDFVLSSDEYFRPVALTLGPDGCLYIVDWYNKIISHNEVPRTHPERDKTRGRIWRVKNKDAKPFEVPDFTKIGEEQLLAKLSDQSAVQVHLAWQAITDRGLTNLAPRLKEMAAKGNIPALWSLEGLRQFDEDTFRAMVVSKDRNVRREAIRASADIKIEAWKIVANLAKLIDEADPEVRAQIIRTAGSFKDVSALSVLVYLAEPSLPSPVAPSTQNGKPIRVREAYEREFQRYLVRLMLERHPDVTERLIESKGGLSPDRMALAALAIEPRKSAMLLANSLPILNRPASDEEILRLAQFANTDGSIETALMIALREAGGVESLIRVRNRFDAAPLTRALTSFARQSWKAGETAQALRVVTAFRLAEFEDDLVAQLNTGSTNQIAALRALREIGSAQDDKLATLAKSAADRNVKQEAVLTLASSRSEKAPEMIVGLWGELNALQRRMALDRIATTKVGAMALVKAIEGGGLARADIDSASLEKMRAVLPEHAGLKKLAEEMTASFQPVLRLDGKNDSWAESNYTLKGTANAFTVETWIKLAPGIDNNDSILGAPGQLDLNFYDGRFRVWVGPIGDVAVAKKKMVAGVWTHLAVTRDDKGIFRIYVNGELDAEATKPALMEFDKLQIGLSNPAGGTDAWFSEFRIWIGARTAQQIRSSFDQALRPGMVEETTRLMQCYTGESNWGKLHGGARIERVEDHPALLTEADAKKWAEKFTKFEALAEKSGNAGNGKTLFAQTCATCHTVAGQGGQIGPVLNGAAANGVETMLRAVLTPNAAMEAGYRTFRVELKDGDVLDGFLVSQNDEAVVLRQPNAQDRRIAQDEIRRAGFTKQSLMPEGLLEAMEEREAVDLLAYLKTLK